MKKLTAGIFSVLVGLCAANSADAAIASKAWVEQDFVAKTTYTTDQADVADAIADAKKAGTDANSALEAYKTSNNAAVALKAAQSDLEATNAEVAKKADKTFVGTLPEDATATTIVGYIDAKTANIASDEALGQLATRVTTNEGAIETLNGSGEGSVTKSITDALASYTTNTVETKVKAVSDALEAHETAAANTYQTKAAMTNTAVEGDAAKLVYPTVALMNTTISNTQSVLNQTVADVSAAAVKNASDITALTTVVGNNKTAAESATKEVADALAAYEASNDQEIAGLKSADTAINTKIGTVAEGKTVVGMIQEAQAAATYDDTQVKADIVANAKTAADAAAANLAKINDNAALIKTNSDNIAANATAITNEVARAKAAEEANAAAAQAADDKADAAQATADAAIPKPTENCTTLGAKCVLTVGNSGYVWESIERATNETVQ